VQKLRCQFREEIREIKAQDMIFIDESRVNLGLVRRYARSQKGERARGAKPSKRGKNVSIIAAISLQGKLVHVNLLGATDGLTFEAFIIRKLVPKLWKGAAVFMDNYSIHKGEEVENAIQGAGTRCIYLPPYSPDFSPI